MVMNIDEEKTNDDPLSEQTAATPVLAITETSERDREEERKREQTTAQINAIESEIRENQPLTSDLHPIGHLVQSYLEDDSTKDGGTNLFLKGACHLSKKYASYRRVRGDGNCYYRAFLYSLCEDLLRRLKAKEPGAQEELERLQAFAKESFQTATKTYGYDEFALEMFQEEFADLMNSLSRHSTLTQADLHRRMNEEGGTSEYCTWYLRVLTACQLKSEPDRFSAFICFSDDTSASMTSAMDLTDGGGGDALDAISSFCSREVEPMGRECGMVQVIALAEIMNVAVSIEYLDGRDFDEGKGLTVHEFAVGDDDASAAKRSKVTLLYRPGHYDILYGS